MGPDTQPTLPAPAPATAHIADPPDDSSPFKFLDAYAEGDKHLFAGRDHDVMRVLAGVARQPIFVLYGRSGLGKTSILLAGAFPRLRDQGYRPVYVRLLSDPRRDVAAAIGAREGEDVLDALRRESASVPLVLAFDQFEEAFLRFEEKVLREQVIPLLDAILSAKEVRARILVSIREDYYGRLAEIPAVAPFVACAHRLEPLSAYGARQAIVRPLVDAKVEYEEDLVTSLVEELSQCAFEPTMLQILCTEVWRAAVRRGEEPLRMTLADWKAVGGAEGIYQRFIERVSAAAPPDRRFQLLLRGVLDAMITRERTKRTVTTAQLVKALGASRVEDVRKTLDHLEHHRLVRSLERSDERWYELRHDRLVDALEAWLGSDEQFVRFRFARAFVAQLAAAPRAQGARRGLIGAEWLESYVDPVRDLLPLDAREAELLLASAIRWKSAHVREWASRLETIAPGSSVAVALSLLEDEDEAVRADSASAVGDVPDPAHAISAACCARALTDPSEAVRRAAGTTFARIATAAEIDALRAEPAASREGRRRMRALLGSLDVAGRLPAWVGPWERRRVHAQLTRELVHAYRDELRRRRWLAVAGGVGAAVLAGPLAIVPFLSLGLFTDVHRMTGRDWLREGLEIALGATVLGGIAGLLLTLPIALGSARASARRTLLSRGGVEQFAPGRAVALPWWLVFAPLLFFILETANLLDSSEGLTLLIALGAAIIVFPQLVRLARLCVASVGEAGSRSLPATLAWIVACAVFPTLMAWSVLLALPGAIAPLAHSGWVDEYAMCVAQTATLSVLAALAAGFAVSLGNWRVPLGKPSTASPRARLAANLAVAGVALLSLPTAAGLLAGSLPIFPLKVTANPGTPAQIRGHLRPGLGEATFARVSLASTATRATPVALRLSVPGSVSGKDENESGPAVYVDGTLVSLPRSVALPEAAFTLAFEHSLGSGRGANEFAYDFTVEPIQVPDDAPLEPPVCGGGVLQGSGWKLARIRLDRQQEGACVIGRQGACWAGTLSASKRPEGASLLVDPLLIAQTNEMDLTLHVSGADGREQIVEGIGSGATAFEEHPANALECFLSVEGRHRRVFYSDDGPREPTREPPPTHLDSAPDPTGDVRLRLEARPVIPFMQKRGPDKPQLPDSIEVVIATAWAQPAPDRTTRTVTPVRNLR